MPGDRRHGRFDVLLNVLRNPPIVFPLVVTDADAPTSASHREFVLAGRPSDARGGAIHAQDHESRAPRRRRSSGGNCGDGAIRVISDGGFDDGRRQSPDVRVPIASARDDAVGFRRPIYARHALLVLVQDVNSFPRRGGGGGGGRGGG